MANENRKQKPDRIAIDSASSRRAFVRKMGGTLAATGIVSSGVGAVSAAETRRSYTIREGTEDETRVYVIDAGEPGPTAVVVGGIHGNEEAGYLAADDVATWSIDKGKLVVIPRSNPVAIERGTYVNDNGNLNRKFPPGKEPTTALARALWNAIDSHNPNTVLNLHASQGIYREDDGPDGSGQAIYPTYSEGAGEDAVMTARYMNRYHVPDSYPEYLAFKRGNTIDADRPLLIHKVAGDMRIRGYILEVTTYDTELDTRVRWHLNMVRHLLRRNGIDRTYD